MHNQRATLATLVHVTSLIAIISNASTQLTPTQLYMDKRSESTNENLVIDETNQLLLEFITAY